MSKTDILNQDIEKYNQFFNWIIKYSLHDNELNTHSISANEIAHFYGIELIAMMMSNNLLNDKNNDPCKILQELIDTNSKG